MTAESEVLIRSREMWRDFERATNSRDRRGILNDLAQLGRRVRWPAADPSDRGRLRVLLELACTSRSTLTMMSEASTAEQAVGLMRAVAERCAIRRSDDPSVRQHAAPLGPPMARPRIYHDDQ